MARPPETDLAEAERVSFDLDSFTLVDDTRLVVTGRWFGVRGRVFFRPSLTLLGDGLRTRLLAELEHKPWAADDGAPWIAAFRFEPPETTVLEVELAVAPDIAVTLEPPDELKAQRAPSRRRRGRIVAAPHSGSTLALNPGVRGAAATPKRPAAPGAGSAPSAPGAGSAPAAPGAGSAPAAPANPGAPEAPATRVARRPAPAAAPNAEAIRSELESTRQSLRQQRQRADRLQAAVDQAARGSTAGRAADAGRDSARSERTAVVAERDAALAERDRARAELQTALHERDEARLGWKQAYQSWREVASERDQVRASVAAARREADAARWDADAARQDADAARQEALAAGVELSGPRRPRPREGPVAPRLPRALARPRGTSSDLLRWFLRVVALVVLVAALVALATIIVQSV